MGSTAWKLLGWAALIVCVATGGQVEAFNDDHLKQLLKTHTCRACNLTGAHLSGANLSYADLAGAALTGSDLYRADLTGADLTGADLAGADLGYANLRWATWTDGRECSGDSVGSCK